MPIRPETEEAQLIQFGDDHDPVHPRRGAARSMNQAYLQKDVGEGAVQSLHLLSVLDGL